jgi:hypothetical protein
MFPSSRSERFSILISLRYAKELLKKEGNVIKLGRIAHKSVHLCQDGVLDLPGPLSQVSARHLDQLGILEELWIDVLRLGALVPGRAMGYFSAQTAQQLAEQSDAAMIPLITGPPLSGSSLEECCG